MSLHLITPPTEDVITLPEAKQHLRVDHSDDDTLIAALIKAAVSSIDPAGGGWLGRAIRPQTWELRSGGFPCRHWLDRRDRQSNCVGLPYPPLISVVSVKYDDGDGVEQTLVEDVGFRVVEGGLGKSEIAPLYSATWPSVRSDFESVRIRYMAGYALTDNNSPAAPDALPGAIKAAVLLMIGDLYEFRETAAVGAVASQIPVSATVESLLGPYRVY